MANISELIGPYGLQIRKMFYLVTPWETMYSSIEEMPFFLEEAIPWFLLLIFLDIFFCWKKGMKDVYDFYDFLVSGTSGFVQTVLNKIVMRTFEVYLYVWVYDRFCIYPLPPDSAWSWIITFFTVDFFYYWLHRAAHEINILWAVHQSHHNSEYFTLATALRMGFFQQVLARFVYLPQALFIPPTMHMTHEALNRLYQFWTHTPVIGRLGPLEWFLNTPSHHRVHHGRNRYCIDKNYAGTLIIWDRMFGTFQPELDSEPVVYGLTHNINCFDPLTIEFGHLIHIFWEKVPSMDGMTNKLKAIFYGPGWAPGKPRLGDLADIPEIEYPVVKYRSGVANWVWIYALFHCAATIISFKSFVPRMEFLPWSAHLEYAASAPLAYFVLGNALDRRPWFPYVELARSLIYFYRINSISFPPGNLLQLFQGGSLLSAAIWIVLIMTVRKNPLDINIRFSRKNE